MCERADSVVTVSWPGCLVAHSSDGPLPGIQANS